MWYLKHNTHLMNCIWACFPLLHDLLKLTLLKIACHFLRLILYSVRPETFILHIVETIHWTLAKNLNGWIIFETYRNIQTFISKFAFLAPPENEPNWFLKYSNWFKIFLNFQQLYNHLQNLHHLGFSHSHLHDTSILIILKLNMYRYLRLKSTEIQT